MTGVAIGFYTGWKIRKNTLMGIGLILGILIGIFITTIIPKTIGIILEIALTLSLVWIAYEEIMKVSQIDFNKFFIRVIAIGGAISLVLFDPHSFIILLNEGSKTTNIPAEGNLLITTLFYYAPITGWISGFVLAK